MLMTGPSRRGVVASLAALPALAGATVAAAHGGAALNDPIFSAIERYRRALEAFESADELSKPSQFEAAGDELYAASEALFATVPTTVAGCLALIDCVLADAGGEDLEHHWAALKSLIEALPQLARSALT
jgi:hypothetical protein